MKCKFCSAEMEAGTICPACGGDNSEIHVSEEMEIEKLLTEEVQEEAQEETQGDVREEAAPKAPRKKRWGLILVAVAAVLAVAAGGLFVFFRWRNDQAAEQRALMEEQGTLYRDSYTADEKKMERAADKVVAQMGDATLTNSQLQVYYWLEYYNFLDSYGNLGLDIQALGLDPETPLDQQESWVEGVNWQQYFLDAALQNWAQVQALTMKSQEDGFAMEQKFRDELDQLQESLKNTASNMGFETVDEMVQKDFGVSTSLADYQYYMELYYTGFLYHSDVCGRMDPTQEELSLYFDENSGLFAEEGITKEDVPFTIDVRHILISPEGGTANEDGSVTYTEEEWAAAEEKAQAILDGWKAAGATEESFAELAGTHSVDPGSASNGGLYPEVQRGEMVEEFNDWCFDPARKAGDSGIVRTKFGYHIMYFSAASEDIFWVVAAREEYLNEMAGAVIQDAIASYEMTVYYDRIALQEVPSQEEVPETT